MAELMPTKKKARFLQKMVFFCIAFTASVLVAAFVASFFPVVNEAIVIKVVDVTALVFGGELLMTVVLRLFEPIADKKGTKENEGGQG